MGRNVDDVALLFSALTSTTAPVDSTAPTMVAASNWRTGNPQTDQLFDDIVEELRKSGLSVTERDFALPEKEQFDDELTVMLAELVDDTSPYLRDRPGGGVKSLADVIAYEDEHRERELIYFGHEFFTMALEGGGRHGEKYPDARRRNLAWAIDTCLTPGLEGVDVLIAPAYGPSWKSDLPVGAHPGPASCVTMAPAIAGWPILCLPMGLVQDLPVGLAIVGRPQSEWTILEAARRIEVVVAQHSPLPRPFWKMPSRG
jgi:amidase